MMSIPNKPNPQSSFSTKKAVLVLAVQAITPFVVVDLFGSSKLTLTL